MRALIPSSRTKLCTASCRGEKNKKKQTMRTQHNPIVWYTKIVEGNMAY